MATQDAPTGGAPGRSPNGQPEDKPRTNRRTIARVLGAGGLVGLFGTVYLERVGEQWSNETWLVLTVGAVAIVGLARVVGEPEEHRSLSRPVVLAVSLAVLVCAIAATAVVVLWDEDRQDRQDACGRRPDGDAVDVMVVWERSELAAFCGVLADYGPDLNVTSVGPDIGAALDARFEGDDPPDVAIIPQPSLVRRYAGRGLLCPTPDDVVDLIPGPWNALVTEQAGASGQDRVYGAVVKGAHKSLFWYDLDALGGEDPSDWSWGDLVNWVGGTVDSPSFDAPLALPAGDRWPLTDWFENQLAGTDPDLYDRLARGEAVEWDDPSIRQTLEDMALLWRGAGVLAGGPEGAADTSWSDVPRHVLEGRAALGFGPSFVAGPADDLPRRDRLWVAGFPRLREGRPLVVGGDFAVIPRSSGDCTEVTAGRDLVRWLTGEEAMRLWSRRDRGFLTPNDRSPYSRQAQVRRGDWEDVRILLTFLIRRPPEGELHFDLSDDRFAVANEGDARGSWDILHAFFRDVTRDPGDLECALDRTIDRLQAEYLGEPPPSAVC